MNNPQTASKNLSILSLLLDIWSQLSFNRRLQLFLLFSLMILSACSEVFALGSILPFLTVISNPNQLLLNQGVNNAAIYFGLSDQILLFVTLLFIFAAIFSGIIRLINLWANGRMAALIGSDLSCEAYKRTLYQPFEFHLQINSSDIVSSITMQIGRTVAALNNFLQLSTAGIVSVFLLLAIFYINWTIALTATIVFGSAYILLATNSRKKLHRNSILIDLSYKNLFRALQEGLGGIREVLLESTQKIYIDTYRNADKTQRILVAKNDFLAAFPRYSIEAIGMVLIAILGYSLSVSSRNTSLIPLLGTLALGTQRMLPAFQQMYAGWAQLNGFKADIVAVLNMIKQPLPANYSAKVSPTGLYTSIVFHDVEFSYNRLSPNVLEKINVTLNRGEKIGIIGHTGSGKSTFIDILMGLLIPTSGFVEVDGIHLTDTKEDLLLKSWSASIAHVPQSVYLSDSSIAENIAFGVPKDQINMERIRQSSKKAQILEFVESYPDGFWSPVGERGIKLSGGQKQRIGIARALYKKSNILVFDEATSALDNATESMIINSILESEADTTIIMIAHRLTTLKNCDRIISFHNGLIVGDDPPHIALASR